MARIPESTPRTIVDLGCGTGSLTRLLAERFPAAGVTGLDNDPSMLGRAPEGSIAWRLADVGSWRPDEPVDLIYSNAALHWLTGHEALFARLLGALAPGGTLAVQMPNNWHEPTHTIPARVLDEGGWPAEVANALPRDRVLPMSAYRRALSGADHLDQWETTYHQVLPASDRHPVLEWVKGSLLTPVMALLEGPDRERFESACEVRYETAYPREADGSVVLPFRRVFLVAGAVASA